MAFIPLAQEVPLDLSNTAVTYSEPRYEQYYMPMPPYTSGYPYGYHHPAMSLVARTYVMPFETPTIWPAFHQNRAPVPSASSSSSRISVPAASLSSTSSGIGISTPSTSASSGMSPNASAATLSSHISTSARSPPLAAPVNLDTDELLADESYQVFERNMLRALEEQNGGPLIPDNPRMRRDVQQRSQADDSYKERRQRNNVAAKQSRYRRKMREIRQGLQVTYLKQQLAELKAKATGPCQNCGYRLV